MGAPVDPVQEVDVNVAQHTALTTLMTLALVTPAHASADEAERVERLLVVVHVGEGCSACGGLLNELLGRLDARPTPSAHARPAIELLVVHHRSTPDATYPIAPRWGRIASVRVRDALEEDDGPPVPDASIYLVTRANAFVCAASDSGWSDQDELRFAMPDVMAWYETVPGSEDLRCLQGTRAWSSPKTMLEVEGSERELERVLRRVYAPRFEDAPPDVVRVSSASW